MRESGVGVIGLGAVREMEIVVWMLGSTKTCLDPPKLAFRARGERYIKTIALLDQWPVTIENH